MRIRIAFRYMPCLKITVARQAFDLARYVRARLADAEGTPPALVQVPSCGRTGREVTIG